MSLLLGIMLASALEAQESSPPGGARDGYRARALELYDALAASDDDEVRLAAVIERFNLQRGRRIYERPNAW